MMLMDEEHLMPDDGKAKGIPWLKVIDDYAHGRGTQAEIAHRYGTTSATITAKKKRDADRGHAWPEPITSQQQQHIVNQVTDRVILTASESLSKALEDNVELVGLLNDLAKHAVRGAMATLLGKDSYENVPAIYAGEKQSRADVAAQAVSVARQATQVIREVAGKKAGESSVDSEANRQRMFRFVVKDPVSGEEKELTG